MLTFDEETHSYFWNKLKVPGVTSILNEWQRVKIGGSSYHVNRYSGEVISSEMMAEGASKGTDLHKGCQIIAQGGIDWSILDGDYIGPLKQFEKWLEDVKPMILFTEAAFYSQRYGFAGTIDLIAQIKNRLAIIDIKTGVSGTVGPQTAAYKTGWCEHNKYTAAVDRYALWLPKTGKHYKFEKLDNEAEQFNFFKACLAVHNYTKGVK